MFILGKNQQNYFQGRKRKDYDAGFEKASQQECPIVCGAATASLGHEQIHPRAGSTWSDLLPEVCFLHLGSP